MVSRMRRRRTNQDRRHKNGRSDLVRLDGLTDGAQVDFLSQGRIVLSVDLTLRQTGVKTHGQDDNGKAVLQREQDYCSAEM